MNKKAFTLLEIMSVVIIIGILLLLAVPAVTKNIITAKRSVYKQHEKTLETTAKSYMTECVEKEGDACNLPAKNKSVKMLLSDFVGLGMLRNGLEDPEGNPKYCDGEDSFVVVKNNAKESNSYDLSYEVCLSCSNYKSGYCSEYASTPPCTNCAPPSCGAIELENKTWTNKEVTVGVRCVGNGVNCIRDVFYEKVTTSGQTVNVTIRDEAGKTATCPVDAYVDRIAPVVGLELKNQSDSVDSLDGWTRGITRVEMTTLTDNLSGINTWGMGTSKKPDFNKLRVFNAEDGISAVYGYGKDNASNIGGLDSAIEIKRDNQAPTISAVDLGYQVYPFKPELSNINVNKVEINSRVAEFGTIKGIKVFFSSNPSGSEIILYEDNIEVNRVSQGATYNEVDLPVPSKIYNNMQITFTNGQEARIDRIEVIVSSQNGFYTNKDLNVYVEAFDLLSTVRDYSFDNGVSWQPERVKSYPSNSPVAILVRDRAGNKTSYGAFNITNIDKTAPTCILSQSGTAGVNGWFSSNVVVSFSTRYDALSGVRDYAFNVTGEGTPKTMTQSTDTNGQKFTGYLLDKAGNIGSCETTVKRDTVAPTCNISINGTLGIENWYRSDVTVTLNTPADDRSGLYQKGMVLGASTPATYNSTTSIVHKADGSNINYYGFVQDQAGNETVCNKTFNRDTVSPTCVITTSADPDGKNGWYLNSATLNLQRSDGLSGIAEYGLAKTAAYNNLATATDSTESSDTAWHGKVKDKAGNEGTCVKNVKIDKTNPTCTVNHSGTAGDSPWYKGGAATISFTSNDSTSGIGRTGLIASATETYNAVTTASQGNTPSAGTKWYAYVEDKAGRTGSCNNTVYVDINAPTCTVSKSNVGTTSGVTATITISDVGSSGLPETTLTKTGLTSTSSYTIKDNAGNQSTCTVNVSAISESRNRSKTLYCSAPYTYCTSRLYGYSYTCRQVAWCNTPGDTWWFEDPGSASPYWSSSVLAEEHCVARYQQTCQCKNGLTNYLLSCPGVYSECQSYASGCDAYAYSYGAWSSWQRTACYETSSNDCEWRTVYD